jgi:hypothetical protein
MSTLATTNIKHPSSASNNIVLDSSARVLVGTSTARNNIYWYTGNVTPPVQFEASGNAYGGLSLLTYSVNNYSPILTLGTSGSDTPGANALVPGNNQLGAIQFTGNDGSNFRTGAVIAAATDSTTGSGDLPTRLSFSTTSDGASFPTTRIIINSGGTMYPATDNAFQAGSGSFRWTAIYAVNGTIQTSDARQKTDVSSCSLGSAFIKSLQPVSYKWIEGGNTVTKSEDGETDVITVAPGERTHWGFLAQDVKAAVDDAGVDFGGWILTDKNDSDSAQGLRYDQFIAPLTKALQEALTEIDVLKVKVAALEAS